MPLRIHPNKRQTKINWAGATIADNNIVSQALGGGSSLVTAGTGQALLTISDNTVSSRVTIENAPEIANSQDNSFAATRFPYFVVDFAVNTQKSNQNIFIGFRQTGTNTSMPVNTENHFGIAYEGQQVANSRWTWVNANGTTRYTLPFADSNIANVTKYRVEGHLFSDHILFVLGSASGVVRTIRQTVLLPTGNMDWQVLFTSLGTGAAASSYLTIGTMIFEED